MTQPDAAARMGVKHATAILLCWNRPGLVGAISAVEADLAGDRTVMVFDYVGNVATGKTGAMQRGNLVALVSQFTVESAGLPQKYASIPV
jgi:hypothetical protein